MKGKLGTMLVTFFEHSFSYFIFILFIGRAGNDCLIVHCCFLLTVFIPNAHSEYMPVTLQVGESSDDHVFKLHKGVRNGVAKLSYKDWNCECDEITKAIVLLAGKDQISSSCDYGVVEIGRYRVSVQLDNGTWISTFPGECESVAAVLNTYQEIQEVGTVSCSYGELGVKAGDGDCTATAAAITQLIDANTPVWNESTCRRQDPGPIPVPVTWVEKQGCCRQKKGDRTHHDTATVHMLPKSSKSKAVAACKQKCEELECSAYEVHKAGKKKNKKFKCETHVAAIDSATRRSKSCKKSQCFFPQV